MKTFLEVWNKIKAPLTTIVNIILVAVVLNTDIDALIMGIWNGIVLIVDAVAIYLAKQK